MREDCPDCGRPLDRIEIIDRGHMDQAHRGLAYVAPGVEKGLFGLPKAPRIAGRIDAWMCGGCGRVLLHGKPDE
jgi:hypothetical protein